MDKKAGHMMMGMMDDDAYMLCKVLDSVAGQAIELKKKIKMGKKLPSWAEYKVYKAGDSIKSAMSSTFSIRDHMPRISIAIKSAPPMGSVLPSNMKKMASPSVFRSMGKALNPPKPPPTPEESGRSQASTDAARRAKRFPKPPPKNNLPYGTLGPSTIPKVKTEEIPALRKKQEAQYFKQFGKPHPGYAAFDRNNPGHPAAKKVKIKQVTKAKSTSPMTNLIRTKPSNLGPLIPPPPPPLGPPTRQPPPPMKKEGMMGNTPFTQQMMGGSGLPGYSKGGPVKKDGYLTDKKGKPYARVHKGEKVVPKEEKTKKAWAKLAMIGDRTMAPVRSIGTNNSVKTAPPKVKPPKVKAPKVEKTGLEYLNTSKAALKTPDGKRMYRTGNVNDRNYKMRAREKLVADPTKVKRTIRSADAYVGN